MAGRRCPKCGTVWPQSIDFKDCAYCDRPTVYDTIVQGMSREDADRRLRELNETAAEIAADFEHAAQVAQKSGGLLSEADVFEARRWRLAS